MSKQNKYKSKATSDEFQKSGGKRPKKNNRHAYGAGNGKFGKKADRIKRMNERENAKT